MSYLFNLTYELVDEDEAEAGDTYRRGYLAEELTLRQAVDSLTEGISEVQVVEASEYPVDHPSWVTVQGTNWLTGDSVSNSLHFPDHLTGASRRRICRLLGCYGLNNR